MADRFLWAIHEASYSQALHLALQWQSLLPFFDSPTDGPADPGATRLALGQIAIFLGHYNEEWTAHLPASRWDPSFAEELAEASRRQRELPDIAPSPTLPAFVRDALERRYEAAVQGAVVAVARAESEKVPLTPLQSGVAKLLGFVCRVAGDAPLADSLER